MVRFPAFCPNCGLVFESSLIDADNVQGLELSGNRDQCPRCGAWAELPDGTFNVVGDTIEVLSASRLTRARLMRLAAVLRQAQESGTPPEATAEQVIAEAPSLRPLVERFSPKMRNAFIAFLLMVIELLLAQGISELRDDSATREDVRRAVEEAMQHVQPQAQPTPSPVTRRPRPGSTRSAPRRSPTSTRTTRDGTPRSTRPKRTKRPGKTYGARKKRKRR